MIQERLNYIGEIKGILCILVVLCHLSCVFFPELYFLDKASDSLELFFINSPLNVITNGNMAVQFFFVISGFLIARKVYIGNNSLDIKHAYIRFLRIVAPAVLLTVILMKSGFMFHLKAYQINDKLSFVCDYNGFDFTLMTIINDIFVRTYIKGSAFVGPFWTIKYEFFGSILSYIIVSCSYKIEVNHRKFIYIVLMLFVLLFIDINFLSFILGIFTYDCLYALNDDKSFLGKIIKLFVKNSFLFLLLFVFGIYLLTCNTSLSGPLYSVLTKLPLGAVIYRQVGIAIFLFALSVFKQNTDHRTIIWLYNLGKLSPYIYAFHWPIILSFGCWLYTLLYRLDYYIAISIVSIFTILIIILFSNFYKNNIATFINKTFNYFCKQIQSTLNK